MKLIQRLRKWLASDDKQKLSPEDEAELIRVKRRLMKFPKLKGCPNPNAHRTAIFKYRRGIA